MRQALFHHLPHLARLADAVADVMLPRECPLAEAVPAPGFRHLSLDTLATLPMVDRAPWCAVCGHPFYGVTAGAQTCEHCEALEPEFDTGRTVMLAHGTGRALVHELKYHGARHLAGDLARLAFRAPGYVDRLRGAVLVPVPLHRTKRLTRGFNQSELLAAALARLVPGAVCLDLLERVRDTPSQTHLDRDARRDNMHHAFALKPGARVDAGRRHIVFDDVFTTGATLNAAALTLRAAGVMSVGIATLAHG